MKTLNRILYQIHHAKKFRMDGKDVAEMKPPEEIKKGLAYCANDSCLECPYDIGLKCVDEVMLDALDYIQQIESRLAQVKRERDAAVRCLMEATKERAVCTGCRHDLGIDGRCEEADFDCKQCKTPCMCKTCEANSNYQWRGVCDDDTEDKE